MTVLSLAQSAPVPLARRRGVLSRIPRAVWNGALLVVGIALVALYLVEVNRTVSYGYRIREAEKRVGELRTEVRANAIKLSERERVGNLTAQAASLGMVPVGSVEYVNTSTTGVALR